jgi:hypothetical protein
VGECFPTAFQRIATTAQFVQQATQAQIANLSAKYDYHSQYQALQYAIGMLR